MPAENFHVRIRVRTGQVVQRLERLAAAFRAARATRLSAPAAPRVSVVETAERIGLLPAAFQEGGLVRRPAPVHFNAPCALPPDLHLARRELRACGCSCHLPPEDRGRWRFGYPLTTHCTLCREVPARFEVHIRDGQGNVLVTDNMDPLALPAGTSAHWPTPGRQDCPICRELAPSVAPAEPIDPVAAIAEFLRLVEVHPLGSGEVLPEYRTLSSLWPAGQGPPPASYTGTEETALEAIRLAGERPNEHLADRYRPQERPTAACSSCPAIVAAEELWVGKRSGIALCDPCMDKWERAGRAKRTGEF